MDRHRRREAGSTCRPSIPCRRLVFRPTSHVAALGSARSCWKEMGSARLRSVGVGAFEKRRCGRVASARWIGASGLDVGLGTCRADRGRLAPRLTLRRGRRARRDRRSRRKARVGAAFYPPSRHKNVLSSVARDVGAVLHFGLQLPGPLHRRLQDVLDGDFRAG